MINFRHPCTTETKTSKGKSSCFHGKRTDKQYFAKSAENQPLTDNSFWNSILPFFTNKNIRNGDVITWKEKGRLSNDELEAAETLNSHYINTVETTCGKTPQALGNPKDRTA